jgi:hypothetical protein
MPAIPIDEAMNACKLAGNGMVPGKAPVQSELNTEASLVGLAYLNYIYQNDIANQHFCEAMLLMHAQVPGGPESLSRPHAGASSPNHGGAGRRPVRFRLRYGHLSIPEIQEGGPGSLRLS